MLNSAAFGDHLAKDTHTLKRKGAESDVDEAESVRGKKRKIQDQPICDTQQRPTKEGSQTTKEGKNSTQEVLDYVKTTSLQDVNSDTSVADYLELVDKATLRWSTALECHISDAKAKRAKKTGVKNDAARSRPVPRSGALNGHLENVQGVQTVYPHVKLEPPEDIGHEMSAKFLLEVKNKDLLISMMIHTDSTSGDTLAG